MVTPKQPKLYHALEALRENYHVGSESLADIRLALEESSKLDRFLNELLHQLNLELGEPQ